MVRQNTAEVVPQQSGLRPLLGRFLQPLCYDAASTWGIVIPKLDDAPAAVLQRGDNGSRIARNQRVTG